MNILIKIFLKQNKFKRIDVKIEGFVSIELEINKLMIIESKDSIILLDNKVNVLKINKHQISKIYSENKNILKIKLDQFIKISLVIKNSK